MTSTIRLALPSEQDALIDVLMDAFANAPFYLWAFDGADREQVLRSHFAASVSAGIQSSQAYTTPGLDGVAIWEGLTPVVAPSQPPKFERRSNFVSAIATLEHMRPRAPHIYLSILATAPHRQGQGVGRSLMQPVLDDFAARGIEAYLETDREENVRFYRGLGFVVTRQLQPGSGPTMWGMGRLGVACNPSA